METKVEKVFDAVKVARQIKDVLDEKLSGMDVAEIVAYFEEKQTRTNPIKPSRLSH